jgi:putative mRNA 3-end processing factor
MDLVRISEAGLYCPPGDFYIDPWAGVDCAVVTHAHSDHARVGSNHYVCSASGEASLRERLGAGISTEALPFAQSIVRNGVRVSLHPAGHILGSAQVRIEYQGRVWVVAGDYKTEPDALSEPFEPVRCHVFFTESTFGLPIYRWEPDAVTFGELHQWWRENQNAQRTSVVFCYALGKAQRILKRLDPGTGPILIHGAVERFVGAYEAAGANFPGWLPATPENARASRGRALVIAPPSADSAGWLRKFGEVSTAFASGWMRVRGRRRHMSLDRGFVISDHADWDGLNTAIRATGAEKVFVTHGYAAVLARWLNESGIAAEALPTRFEGETADAPENQVPATPAAPETADGPVSA